MDMRLLIVLFPLLAALSWAGFNIAVPKKRTSSSKTKSRHATWVNKAIIQRERAISLAKSVLNENSGSFIYSNNKTNIEEEE